MDEHVKLAKTLAPTAWRLYQPMLDPASPHILLQLLPAFARMRCLWNLCKTRPRGRGGLEVLGGQCSVRSFLIYYVGETSFANRPLVLLFLLVPRSIGGCHSIVHDSPQQLLPKMRIGISKPEAVHETPREVWNWRLFWSAAVFGTLFLLDKTVPLRLTNEQRTSWPKSRTRRSPCRRYDKLAELQRRISPRRRFRRPPS
jgi:hypothetical protein